MIATSVQAKKTKLTIMPKAELLYLENTAYINLKSTAIMFV